MTAWLELQRQCAYNLEAADRAMRKLDKPVCATGFRRTHGGTPVNDIVAELDRQLLHWHEPMLERARDEIVALRALHEKREASAQTALADLMQLKDIIEHMPTKVRTEALEEAARVCDDMARSNAAYTWPAAAIRALKEKH